MTEHNILVISGYYGRLRMERLAQLLDLTPQQAGPCLCGFRLFRSSSLGCITHCWAGQLAAVRLHLPVRGEGGYSNHVCL